MFVFQRANEHCTDGYNQHVAADELDQVLERTVRHLHYPETHGRIDEKQPL